jgi:predicted membrane-bound dolichyl-phosphate-mannose-protein mannosyltransferase
VILLPRIFFIAILLLAVATGLHASEQTSADRTAWGAAQWSSYDWNVTSQQKGAARFDSEPGNLFHITADIPNDARFVRELPVEPGAIYHFSCRIRTDNVGAAARGAGISVINILDGSPDVKGSSDWKNIDFYGKAGPEQQTVTVTLGIGGYGSLNIGSAWFKDIQVEKTESELPATVKIIPLSASAVPEVKNGHGGTVIAVIGCCGLLLILWGRALRRRRAPPAAPLQKESTSPPLQRRLNRFDGAIMALLTLVSIAVSLFNLGGHRSPETGWSAASAGESVTIELGRETELARFYYYCGINPSSGDGSSFTLSARNSTGTFVPVHSFTKEDVNIWKFAEISVRTNAVRLTAVTPGGRINEIALVKKGSKTALVGLRIADKGRAGSPEGNPQHLIDERSAFEYAPSFLTGFYFDEIYHARSAWETLHQIEPYETTHPPLGKLLISVGIALFGMNGFGWRIVGALFGVALVPLMYLVGLKLFRERFYAFCAAFLMMVDFMRFAQSRVAVIDVYGVFFILLIYYFILDLFPEDGVTAPRSTTASLMLAGVAFGIGAACKWIALYAGGGMGMLVILKTLQDLKRHNFLPDRTAGAFLLRRGALCLVAFVLIPTLIYLLAYIPFLQLPGPGHELADVLRLQKHMFSYHSLLKSTHPFSSPWWSWLLDLRPMWMYTGTGLPPGTASTIVSFGNPAIWWLAAPALATTAYLAIKERQAKLGVLLLAFSFQYLPWIGVNRLVFIYHFFSAVPFVILCIVAVIKHLEHRFTDVRPIVQLYLAVSGGLFILFYPALSGLRVPEGYIASLKWLPTWLF